MLVASGECHMCASDSPVIYPLIHKDKIANLLHYLVSSSSYLHLTMFVIRSYKYQLVDLKHLSYSSSSVISIRHGFISGPALS
jgi:hypothetical protein